MIIMEDNILDLKEKCKLLNDANNKLAKEIIQYKEENKQIKERIQKIIEYIENKLSTDTYQHLKEIYDDIDKIEYVWEEYEFEDLLKILKGEE